MAHKPAGIEVQEKRTINWHFLWISVVVSVTVSVPVSYILFGEIHWNFLVIGAIVPLIVAPAMIYMSYMSRRRVERELEVYRQRLEALVEERTLELALSEQRYRAMFESSPVGILITDKDGFLIEPNSKFLEMLGYNRQELKVNFDKLTHPDDIDKSIELHREMLEGKRDGFDTEKRYIRKDGSVMWGRVRVTSIWDTNGNFLYTLVMVEDITERIAYEREMQKARNLGSLGVLAGGIAHDYNNILTVMLNNIAVARAGIPEGLPAYDKLVQVEQKFWQAKNLSRQLMTFAGGNAPARKTASVADLLMDTVKFSLSGTAVALEFQIAPDIRNASIDKGQISQVFSNIALNAKDSMGSEGTFKVRAENAVITAKSGLPIENGKYVFISMKDTGPGISDDILPNIFDPYFTTKEQGTGLGLATSYSIIKKHGGHIAAENAPGGGARFYIYLPATDEATDDVSLSEDGRSPEQGVRVLVMDDDLEIAESIKDLLEVIGHRATVTAEGQQAIDEYRRAMQEGNPYDMCLLDLTVRGGLGGKEALEGIRAADPSAKAVVSSGYSDKVVLSRFRDYGFNEVLPKPYSLDELRDTITRVTQGPGT